MINIYYRIFFPRILLLYISNIIGENKEESAKVSKKDKKGKSGKNVPSYLL